MKSTITACLGDWVTKTHGADVWHAIQVRSGAMLSSVYRISDDEPDDLVERIFTNTVTELRMPQQELYEAFGYHWMSYWLQTHFAAYLHGITSFRDLITLLADIHDRVTVNVPNARPPQFDLVWTAPDVLDIHYRSERNMVGMFVALARGAIRHYGDLASAELNGHNHVRVVWQPVPVHLAMV